MVPPLQRRDDVALALSRLPRTATVPLTYAGYINRQAPRLVSTRLHGGVLLERSRSVQRERAEEFRATTRLRLERPA